MEQLICGVDWARVRLHGASARNPRTVSYVPHVRTGLYVTCSIPSAQDSLKVPRRVSGVPGARNHPIITTRPNVSLHVSGFAYPHFR
jgi:hypothetical protein